MYNIVIPMAGAGSRFASAGYKDPKPLIDVFGFPMIEVVVNNLRPNTPHRFIFICQKRHVAEYELVSRLEKVSPGAVIIQIDGLTEGAACTVLAAADYIDNSSPLMIANSDQYVDVNIDDYLEHMNKLNLDGLIMTMTANDPKWSYAGVAEDQLVTHVVEKKVVSDEATVGIYNFARGADFVSAANKMIGDKKSVNGEYYVAPVYNEMIELGLKTGVFNIGVEGAGMYGLGIPDDLEKFLSNPSMARRFL